MRRSFAAPATLAGLLMTLCLGCGGDSDGDGGARGGGQAGGSGSADRTGTGPAPRQGGAPKAAAKPSAARAAKPTARPSAKPSAGRSAMPAGLADLVADLSHKSLRRRLAALTRLARKGPDAAPAIPAIMDAAIGRRPGPADLRLRHHAAWALPVIDPAGRHVGAALVARMADRKTRDRAWEMLAEMGRAPDPALADVIAASEPAGLRAGDWVRMVAARAEAVDPAQAARIARLTASRNPPTRQAAAIALGMANGAGAEALWPLLDSPDKFARKAADKALKRLGLASAPGAAARKHRSAAIQSKAAELLGRDGPTGTEAVEALRALLRDGTPEGQAAAAGALAVIGPPASEAATGELLGLLTTPDRQMRPNVGWALGMIGRPMPQAVAKLKAVAAARPLRSNTAMWTMGRFGQASKPLLPAMLDYYRGKGKVLGSGAIEIGYACESIGQIGPQAVEALDVLLGPHAVLTPTMGPAKGWALARIGKPSLDRIRLSLRNREATTACIFGLDHAALMGSDAVALLPDIVRLLRTPAPAKATQSDCSTASHAARALGAMGPSAGQAVPALVPWLKTTSRFQPMDAAQTRMDVATALGRIGPGASAALPALLRMVTDAREHKSTRERVARALPHIAKSPQVVAALAKALHDTDGHVRLAAAEGLGWIGTNALKAIVPLLRTGDDKRKVLALMALAVMGPAGRDARRDVVACLGNLQSAVGQRASAALAAMGPYARDVADDVEQAARKAPSDGARGTGLAALAMLRRSEADATWLLTRVMPRYPDAPDASKRLAGLGLAAEEALGELRLWQLSGEVLPGAEVKHLTAAVLLGRLDPQAARGVMGSMAREAYFSRFFPVRRAALAAANAMQAELARRSSPAMRKQVAALRARVAAARPGDVEKALAALGTLGPAVLPAAPDVARLYGTTRDGRLRQAAGKTMERIFLVPGQHPDRTEALVWQLRHPDEAVAGWAAAELRTVGAPAVPIVCQSMRDGKDVRRRSIALLVALGAKDRASVTLLVKTANALDPRQALAAVRALEALGVAADAKTTSGPVWDDAGGYRVIRGLALLGAREVPVLAAKIASEDFNVREEAIVGLLSCTAASVDALVGLLGCDSASTRRHAAEALGDLGSTAAPAADALRRTARAESDPHTSLALNRAIQAVGGAAGPASPAAAKVPADVAALLDQLNKGRLFAVHRAMKKMPKDHYPALVQGLSHHSAKVRQGTAVAIGMMAPPPAGAVDALRKALAAEPHPRTRTTMLESTCRLADTLLPEVVAAIDDKQASIRLAAARAMAKLGPAAAPARAKLLGVLGGTDRNVAMAAGEALAAIGPSVLDGLLPLLDDKNELARCGAIYALEKMGAKAASALPKLEALERKDPRSSVRRMAGNAAATIRLAQRRAPASP